MSRTCRQASSERQIPPGSAIPSRRDADVDAIAENVLAVDQNIAEIDADSIEDALRLGELGVALSHHGLDCDRAFDRGHYGGKLRQHAVARRLDETSAEAPHDRRRRLATLAHQLYCASLVLAHEARIADHIGGEDRCQLPDLAHSSPPA
ncbi:MAG TPA: hypothetical protein VFE60_23115 [Roseiarcus sp.]|nr:hypothetical protein [Roseiarcus sp.]